MSDIFLILSLIVLNGLFAMSEIAVISARKARLHQRADEGHAGARAALELANEPGNFLSTIQVGITAVGVLTGAIGEAAMAGALSEQIAVIPALAPYSQGIALSLIVLGLTYLSVVIGELVPKRIALHGPENIASLVARPMQCLARLAYPVVKLLSASSDLVLKLLRVRPVPEPPVTQEEIQVLMEQGAEAGVFEETEQTLVSNILRLDQKKAAAIMTPRMDIFFLDIEEPFEENRRKIVANAHSRIPVCKGGLDHILGVLQSKDLLARSLSGQTPDLTASLRAPLYLPETISPIQMLETFKKTRNHLAFIVDEYGELQGLVTLHDVLEAIAGDIPTVEMAEEPLAVQRADGSWLIDGTLSVDKFRELFELEALPKEDAGNYHTVGGFVMMELGRVPAVTDRFEQSGLRFEVIDMDRNRVDKVLVTPLKPTSEETPGQ
jgi:putative hemolysin